MRVTRPIVLAAALALALAASGCSTKAGGGGSISGDRMTIYSSQPLVGALGQEGQDVVAAERLALEEAGGRVGRWRIRLVALDNADAGSETWDPGVVSANARRASQDDKTIAYLGEMDTGASAVSIPILNEPGILQLSPSDTVAGFTRKRSPNPGEPEKYYPTRDRNFARVVPPDDVQAAALVESMQDARITKLFVVNDEALYGRSLALEVQRAAGRAGIQVVKNQGVDPDRFDPASVAADIAGSGAGAMFFGGVLTDGAAKLFAEVAKASPRMQLFGPNALATPAFAASLGPAARNTLLTAPTLPPSSHPAARAFYRAFQTRYGRPPGLYAVYGYEAMTVVLQAIRDARKKGNNRNAVIEAVFDLRRSGSVLGDYSIDEAGDTTTRVYGSYRVRNGKLVFGRVLDPFGA